MLTNVKRKKEIDIVGGPILKSMILYALPLIATNLLQLLFNAADVAVLGIFSESGDGAVAAVGATGSLIQLIINLFVGLSVGTNVLVAGGVCAGQFRVRQRRNGKVAADRRVFGGNFASLRRDIVVCGLFRRTRFSYMDEMRSGGSGYGGEVS